MPSVPGFFVIYLIFQITKRELTVVDRSGSFMRLTLWGKQAEQYHEDGQHVVAFKGVRAGDFV